MRFYLTGEMLSVYSTVSVDWACVNFKYFAIPADHGETMVENHDKKMFGSGKRLEKAIEHETNGNTMDSYQ